MGHWNKRAKPFINTNIFAELMQDKQIVVIDGGAANDVFEPFDKVSFKNTTMVLFEPNKDAVCYEGPFKTIQVPLALWKDSNGIELHVAKEPTTSSVYAPNTDLLQKFPNRIGIQARQTTKKICVDSISIDEAVQKSICDPPDFIKLDIHSAEFEALKGAEKSLANCSGVLVETWHSKIHRGQHLHAEVECLLNNHGFYLYDFRPASKWSYRTARDNLFDRRRMIGSETLYFRESYMYEPEKLFVAISLLDLFEYTGICLDILNTSEHIDPTIADKIRAFITSTNTHNAVLEKFRRKYFR